MAFVLDASVALAWCFDDERDPAADALRASLRDDHAIVPSHWRLEVANALRTGERRNRLTRADSEGYWADLHHLDIRAEPAPEKPDALRLLDLARQFELTVYDAAYLDLAMRRSLPLATRDERLLAGAVRAGVPLALRPPQSP